MYNVFAYFEKVFVRIYHQYVVWKDETNPDVTAILLLSLFQTFNVLALIFLIGSIFNGINWTFSRIEMLGVGVLVLVADYIRIYRIVGLKTILAKYDTSEKRKLRLHPLLYFLISLCLLAILKMAGLCPNIT
jgi:hypothetical protein